MIRPYLREIINDHKTKENRNFIHDSSNTVIDHKTQGKWKIQLTMLINIMSSKYSDGIRTMHTKINNI